MQRRASLVMAAAPLWLQGCAAQDVRTFPTLASAQQAIAALKDGRRSAGTWTLPQMLNHAAQSVEYSLHGFPALRSALFRHTAGNIGFAVFDARGVMQHDLADPIPGAPALASTGTLDTAIQRLQQALLAFDAHSGALQPHFAYGVLNKPQYLRAHLMHLANHWTEVVRL